MRTLGLLAVLLLGCSAAAKPVSPAPGAVEPAPVEAGPKDTGALPADGPAADAGEACGGSTCKAPEQCARKECWIPRADRKCPEGMVRERSHDGPGRVCVGPG